MDKEKLEIDGRFLKAFMVVMETHKRFPQLNHIGKQIQHYRFEFAEDDRFYLVRIISKSKTRKVGYGNEGDFWVLKSNYEYVARLQGSGKEK